MTKQSLNCPACNGSQFSEGEFRRYSCGSSISTVGPGLTGVLEAIPMFICLCGYVFKPKSPIRQIVWSRLSECIEQARASEAHLQSWAAQLVNASELDKYNEDVRRLEELAKVKLDASIVR